MHVVWSDNARGVVAGKGWHCDLCRVNCSGLSSLQVRILLRGPRLCVDSCPMGKLNVYHIINGIWPGAWALALGMGLGPKSAFLLPL